MSIASEACYSGSLLHRPLMSTFHAQEAKTVDRSASPEERLTEEEAAEVESGTGRKVEKRDAEGQIYIGFDKNDPTPRAGRKGRMIDDNEERYPSRSEMVGGWAGGEKGLRAFIEVTSINSVSLSMLDLVSKALYRKAMLLSQNTSV